MSFSRMEGEAIFGRSLTALSRYAVLALVTLSFIGCPPLAPPSLDEISTRLRQDFVSLDLNDNGLSIGEARMGVPSLTPAQFSALDMNDDGRLSLVEVGGMEPGEGEGEAEGEGEGEGIWPGASNAFSWDGSWDPEINPIPPVGLLDALYFDGHDVNGNPSPLLPPGNWDFVSPMLVVSPLANFNSFKTKIGTFVPLKDEESGQYGWRLVNSNDVTEFDFAANPFDGSSGTDVVDVGPGGRVRFSDAFGMADGPDMMRFEMASASDWRLGSELTGGANDNDLVIGGTEAVLASDASDVRTCTVHTGPGRDLVFMNNMNRAAIDLGNGGDGRTDTLDENDGDDLAVIGRNFLDCRVYGGGGDDVFVWYIDEANKNTPLLKNSFFGGGGWEPADWADTGIDRVVLVVPTDTVVFSSTDLPSPGTIQVRIPTNYNPLPVPDLPTIDDVFARYSSTAGLGPDGRHTMIFDYFSASGEVRSGFIFVTAIEEFQVGLGADAKVYRLDDIAGVAILDEELEPIVDVPDRDDYHEVMDDFLSR